MTVLILVGRWPPCPVLHEKRYTEKSMNGAELLIYVNIYVVFHPISVKIVIVYKANVMIF